MRAAMLTTLPSVISALVLAGCQVPPAGPRDAPAERLQASGYRLQFSGGVLAAPAEGEGLDALTVRPADRVGLQVTVYQEDLGLVTDARRVPLGAGEQAIRFSEVAARLDPGSVRLTSPDGPAGLQVLEQRYALDAVSRATLLAHYVGKEIGVRLPAEPGQAARVVPAKLISAADGGIVSIDGQIYLQAPGELIVPALPPGLAPTPTLAWRVTVPTSGERTLAATYLTGGLGWQATYDLTLDETPNGAELAGWAAITNLSGVTLPSARVTLVAGQPSRAYRPLLPLPYEARRGVADLGLADRALDVYRAYDLEGAQTLEANETRQLPLFPPTRIPVVRRFTFDGDRQGAGEAPAPVRAELTWQNRAADGLGRHLPAGVARAYLAEGASLRFLGEAPLAHTPPDARVDVDLGAATGLTAQRRTLSFRQLAGGRVQTTAAVTLRNATGTAATVEVIEHPVGDWRVVASTLPARRIAADEVRFDAEVPAGGEQRLEWTLETVTEAPPDGEAALSG